MGAGYVVGAGMVRFGKHAERGIKSLAAEALELALRDAGVPRERLGSVWFANSAWGFHGGQDSIRGEVALRPAGVCEVPIVNVENACAGGATALHGALLSVTSGAADAALAIGVEKMHARSRLRTFAAFLGGLDVEALPALAEQGRALRAAHPPPVAPRAARPPSRRGRPLRDRLRSLLALPGLAADALAVADHYRLDVPALAAAALRDRAASAGGRSPLHGHLRHRGAAAHGAVRHDPGAARADRRQEPRARRAQPAGPEAAPDEHGRGARRSRAGVPADAGHVRSDRRRSGGGARVLGAFRQAAGPLLSGRARARVGAPLGARGFGRRARDHRAYGPRRLRGCAARPRRHRPRGGARRHLVRRAARERGARLLRRGRGRPVRRERGHHPRRRDAAQHLGRPRGARSPDRGVGDRPGLRAGDAAPGEAGARQVERARVALAQNGGGMLQGEEAAMGVHVLEAPGRRRS
ncbi:MAG: hypothetical protein M5U28_56610 [Sandaracinaceae bacterium]|nr:hypothetical protein [Sandaracinaceae bacterium]